MDLPTPLEFGRRVRAEREAHAWSRRELARRSGLGLYTVQVIESGKGGATVHTLLVLCATFRLSPNDLTGWGDTA
jgi:transcriptional regulator with XRE-family HTH domain